MTDYIQLLKDKKSIIDEEAINAIKKQREVFTLKEQDILQKINSLSTHNIQEVENIARLLIPWLKGPFHLNDLVIDAEWRSDYKWQRLLPKLENLENKKILDIGTNNGYFLFQMAELRPALALGIDPIVSNFLQFTFIKKFFPEQIHAPLCFELLGIEHLPFFKNCFDVIFSMGIIYHHRHPLEQLLNIKSSLKNGGILYLETIGIPGVLSTALFPEGRYANMKNVWFVPTLTCLINWLKRTGFKDIEIISTRWEGTSEQRLTEWCPPPKTSFNDAIDPENNHLTIEGHPAPLRFLVKAKRWDG